MFHFLKDSDLLKLQGTVVFNNGYTDSLLVSLHIVFLLVIKSYRTLIFSSKNL